MQVLVIAFGKVHDRQYISLYQDYIARMKPWGRIEIREMKEGKALTDLDGWNTYCLDEHGKTLTTEEFAGRLKDAHRVAFIIGGPDGLAPNIKKKYPCISLSDLTMPHALARLVLLEQIYRCMSLLHKHPYHRA